MYFYSEDQYAFSRIILYFSFALSGSSLLIYFIGIFSKNKLAGLEIAWVVQYTFIVLIWTPGYLHLPYYYMSGLKYSTGYNYLFSSSTYPTNPEQVYTFDLSLEYFSSNFNFVMILPLIPIVCLIRYYCSLRK